MSLNSDGSSRPDIARQVEAEKQLEISLAAEKEVRLGELGRVRNNLQIMISLLELQAATTRNQQAREAFKVSRDRLKAMAFAHEGLFPSRGRSEVDLADCTSRLVKHLFSSYDARGIEPLVDVGRILLDIDQAIPCVLIINELVSNALKHAFPAVSSPLLAESRNGYTIRVEMHVQDGHYILAISDNGVGFPAEVDLRSTTSLGMQLVTMLAKQLGGAIQLDRSGGTTFTITFQGGKLGKPLL